MKRLSSIYAVLGIDARTLAKMAKLESKMTNDAYGETLSIYDDADRSSVIVYMNFNVTTVGQYLASHHNEANDVIMELDKDRGVLYVTIVDTVNMEYPDRDAAVKKLFFAFRRIYREQYNDYLIATDFRNYELQELFKKAIENGIFPKESLYLIKQTSEELYKKDPNFNMDNREFIQTLESVMGKNNVYELDEGGFGLTNPSISEIQRAFEDIIDFFYKNEENPTVKNMPQLIPDETNIKFDYRIDQDDVVVYVIAPAPYYGMKVSGTTALNDLQTLRISMANLQELEWFLRSSISPQQFINRVSMVFGECTLIFMDGSSTKLSEVGVGDNSGVAQTGSINIKRLLKRS